MSYGPYHVICYTSKWVVQDWRYPTGPHMGTWISVHRSQEAAHRKARSLAAKLERGK